MKEKDLLDEYSAISIVYASIIVAGRKTIDQVPVQIREEVKAVLGELGRPDLAVEANEKQD